MSFNLLKVSNVRNIKSFTSSLNADCIIISGDNGSGKTSLIESVYMLCRGKSFKSKNLDSVINHDESEFLCFAELKDRSGGHSRKIGISRNRVTKSTVMKIDGAIPHSLSQIVSEFPVLLITPGTFKLVEGGPSERRKFIDWGVFHVEPSYKTLWRNWRISLSQRNKLLRSGRISHAELDSWTGQFVDLSLELVALRQKYFDLLSHQLNENLAQTIHDRTHDISLKGILNKVSMTFYQGWSEKRELKDLLQESLDIDKKRGFTGYGPHKGDIQFRYYNVAVSESLSRGQLKLYISYLLLAQLRILKEENAKNCTVLIDDIGAELDIHHQKDFLVNTLKEDAQVFVAVLDFDHAHKLRENVQNEFSTQMFHV